MVLVLLKWPLFSHPKEIKMVPPLEKSATFHQQVASVSNLFYTSPNFLLTLTELWYDCTWYYILYLLTFHWQKSHIGLSRANFYIFDSSSDHLPHVRELLLVYIYSNIIYQNQENKDQKANKIPQKWKQNYSIWSLISYCWAVIPFNFPSSSMLLQVISLPMYVKIRIGGVAFSFLVCAHAFNVFGLATSRRKVKCLLDHQFSERAVGSC